MWPDDDDVRTAAAIEKKIDEVFRYGRFEGLRWRGASDAWIEKWWPRFADQIAEGLAKSHQREKVPVIDAEGLAIAAGAEIRGATILPPTHAGWQRFLELAPASGESFTTLKDIGLSWWGRRVPQDLLSKERNLLRELVVPRLLEDTAYRNARENSDPQNARIEHDKALGRVMLDLFTEDTKAHEELYRRYAEDEAFRRSLSEQSFAATYPPAGTPETKPTTKAKDPGEPRVTDRTSGDPPNAKGAESARSEARKPSPVSDEDAARFVVEFLADESGRMSDYMPETESMKPWGFKITLYRLGKDVTPESELKRTVTVEVVDKDTMEVTWDDDTVPAKVRSELLEIIGRAVTAAYDPASYQSDHSDRPGNVFGPGDLSTPKTSPAGMLLRVERATPGLRPIAIRKEVGSLEEASREYRAAVDASGEGASTFPRGRVILADGQKYDVSYNGRVWRGDRLMFDPQTSSADPKVPPTRTVDRSYEEARSAIKMLGLPARKYAQYVAQAEKAIASGKSYVPIVERARKAAEKLTEGKRTRSTSRDAAAAPRPPRRILDAALDTFNAEPRWRLALRNTIPNGWVLVVYPEGKDPEAAVVAVDVIMENVDDVRWLDDRLPQTDRDTIMERLDRALWAAFEAREENDGGEEGEDKTEIPSPLQGLIELMERRSKSLGTRPDASRDIGRTDGYEKIARALQDLAVPSGIDAEELQKWLEAQHLMAAGDIVARARIEPTPVSRLMRNLWDSVLEAFEVAEVDEVGGSLRVPGNAIHDIGNHETILERVVEGDSASLRPIRVTVTPDDVHEDGTVTIDDPTDRLVAGALVHLRGRSERALAELYQKLRAFHHNLILAPKTLQDVRVLLYWTAVMLDAPLCQGEVKARASAAFEQAKQYYDTARWRLMDGVSVDAVRRMHEALRRISAAAAEIARNCGEGQIEIAVTPPHLPVTPEDRAAILDQHVEDRP